MKIEFKDYKAAVDFAYNLTRNKYIIVNLFYDYDNQSFIISEEANAFPYRLIVFSDDIVSSKNNYLKAVEYGIKYVDAMEELEMEEK